MAPSHTLLKLFLLSNLSSVIHGWALPQSKDGNDDGSVPGVLIGDLVKGVTTSTGRAIADILVNNGDAQNETVTQPYISGTPSVSSCASSKDVCCIWYAISADLTNAFKGPTGRCNDLSRSAIRLGFHDAGAWSKKLAAQGQDFGGADGSFVLFGEISRPENKGLERIADFATTLHAKYPSVSMADLIQYMANHATVTCPLGPRVRTYVGRKDGTRASPEGLIPSPDNSADVLIDLFNDKTISPHELTALVGAHTSSKQFAVDTSPGKIGKPQDSTPGVWDVKFYNETLQVVPVNDTFRFKSDVAISRDPRCAGEWMQFVGDQNHWNEDYSRAYVRLSLLGVKNINDLQECTGTLPPVRHQFNGASIPGLDQRRRK